MNTTLKSITHDLNRGYTDCLYFATEVQIYKLIERDAISEDYFYQWMDCQEEMSIMLGELS